MGINQVTEVKNTCGGYEAPTAAKVEAVQKVDKVEDKSVVYEKSSDITKMSESDRAALVKQLKADQETRKAQFTQLVMDMIGKQGSTFAIAQDEDSIWKFIASGEYTVDEAAKAEAQEAISEDGYWGVEQTSQRIFDFALALTGGDEDKMDDMLKAFEKGFEEATKSWGKELPDISQKTKEAVYAKFEEFKNPPAEEIQ